MWRSIVHLGLEQGPAERGANMPLGLECGLSRGRPALVLPLTTAQTALRMFSFQCSQQTGNVRFWSCQALSPFPLCINKGGDSWVVNAYPSERQVPPAAHVPVRVRPILSNLLSFLRTLLAVGP